MESPSVESGEFPTLYACDTEEPAPYQVALFHLQQGLLALRALSPGRDARRKVVQEEMGALQQQVLTLLHLHFAPDELTAQQSSFGQRLRQHRKAADLTQEDLARLAGLSPSLVRKLEQGVIAPTRTALLALCSVPELKLVPSVLGSSDASRDGGAKVSPNWYVPPGFDSVQMIHDLGQQLNGSGGKVEQTHVYLDHKSALDWIALCNAGHVAAWREATPLAPAAKQLRELTGPVGLDVIALGPGDGKTEVRLVQRLLEHYDNPSIRLYLVDASQPLLSRSFKHAMDTLDDQHGLFVCAIQGNFHHLARYTQLHYTPARSHRRRIYTLLGGTVGNLENEPEFFRHSLVAAAPGDLLLLDFTLAVPDATSAEEIWKRDPALRKPITPLHERWLKGPLFRYCTGITDAKLSYDLDLSRPIPGSYGINFMADVRMMGGQSHRFGLWSARRYGLAELVKSLRMLGWDAIGQYPYGEVDVGHPSSLLVLQKRHDGRASFRQA